MEHRPPDYCPHTQLLKDGKPHTSEVHEPRLGGDFLVTDIPSKDEAGQRNWFYTYCTKYY